MVGVLFKKLWTVGTVLVGVFAEVGGSINCIGFLYQPKYPGKK
ncbi:hypothetical protein Amet_0627 [Alkaliphilus metalliredigens QYMF]|uniref:Cyclic lactone autoinducer peptide n=1 Tax=Alkaliphilus metalliredigens (strain QYMF) TaxID=293826 RepID=A6TKY5_ALKMQ|nr:cyclic lactone autoinducer peptide [Alkaliphilus metalliredigens]ABR46853.1 hypothetical protein Amet_0627 [Alkaliphilus metalliredigens QYMF]